MSSASVNEACCLGCDASLCSCYCFGERLCLASQLIDLCFKGKCSKTKPKNSCCFQCFRVELLAVVCFLVSWLLTRCPFAPKTFPLFWVAVLKRWHLKKIDIPTQHSSFCCDGGKNYFSLFLTHKCAPSERKQFHSLGSIII